MPLQLKFKTVQGKQFELGFDEDTKVADMKAKIEETQGADFPATGLNVIYQGKILKDDTTLKDSNVTEAGFCVVMVMKKKAATPTAAPAADATPAAITGPPAETAPATAAAAPAEPAAALAAAPEAAATAAPADAQAAAGSELVTGSALEEKINQICEMGFDPEQVIMAMRAAYNNPGRAVEYLMSGIPTGLEQPAVPRPAAGGGAAAAAPAAAGAGMQQQQPAAAAPVDQPFDMFGNAPGSGGAEDQQAGGPLAALRNNPQFQGLRAVVQERPELLQPMLAELGKEDPAMLELINANQQEFLAMVNEPIGEGGMEALLQQLAGQMGEEGGVEPMGVQVELSQQDMDAIDRLAALGFDRNACLEAFLICEKNETLAANYLLENGGDMM